MLYSIENRHYAGHYDDHYADHYDGHYADHYDGHYIGHYADHYTAHLRVPEVHQGSHKCNREFQKYN